MADNSVQSLERAFSLLEVLSKYPKGVQLATLTAETGLNKSTIHRLLASLISLGYVTQDEVTRQYRLTIRLFEVGSKALRDIDVVSVARPYLLEIGNRLGEVVKLSVPVGSDVVCVYIEDNSVNAVKVENRLGDRSPMYRTSSGKAILADLSDDEIRNIWDASDIVQKTPKTITKFNVLMDEIQMIRQRGYAFDDEEHEPGICCTAISIQDYAGRIQGAVSIAVPASRASNDPKSPINEALVDLRKKLCAEFGNSIQ